MSFARTMLLIRGKVEKECRVSNYAAYGDLIENYTNREHPVV
jgi:hypothetical protein